MKIFVVFGTRPEAIKMAPVIKEIQKRENHQCVVCVTAQHRQMLDQVLDIFQIKTDYDLDLMKNGQSLNHITITILEELGEILLIENPDIVLVHGDTTTAFAASLAAFYKQILVGHVEAGLRTYNKYSPYPEELNRQMVDCISDLFFAPTDQSRNNLINENKKKSNIYVTGNTVIDALKTTINKKYDHKELEWVNGRKLILLTAHRRENHGNAMENIFRAVNRITNEFDDVCVIYPVHLNPAVFVVAHKELSENPNVRVIEPLDVFDFHNFMNKAHIILTDSGGIQEEAPSLGKPVLVLRDTTERPEGIEAGTLKLVGTEEENVYNEIKDLLTDKNKYNEMSKAKNPYGDGYASKYIVDEIENYFGKL